MKPHVQLLFASLLIALGISSVRMGLDGERYVNWAVVLSQGDIHALGDPELLSSQGVPFFQWSAGPGLLVAPLDWVLRHLGQDPDGALLVGGIFSAAVFWLCFYASLREFCDHREAATGVLLTFIATPLGYYSRSISSETISLLPAGILLLQAVRLAQGKPNNWALTGAAGGLLLMVRSFLGAYAWPVLVAGLWTSCRQGKFLAAVGMFFPWIALALWQVGTVHYWMTGSCLKSPYDFGDAEFRSLDPACPHLWNVLLDPFHGLIPTHPLVGLGIFCIPGCLVWTARRRQWPAAILWGCALLAIGINIYAQGSWYYWCGLGFGMRGLVLVSIPAVWAFLTMLFLSRNHPWLHRLLVLVVGLCAVYSFLHALQGPTHYLTWARLLEGQVRQLLDVVTGYQLAMGVIGGAIAVGLLLPCRAADYLLGLLLVLVGIYLFERSTSIWLPLIWLGILSLAILFQRLRLPLEKVAGALQWAGPIAFICAMALFAPFAWKVQGLLKPTAVAAVVFQEGDVKVAYLFISGQRRRADFAAQAEQLRQFLTRQRGEQAIPEVDPGAPAEFTYQLRKQMQKAKLSSRYD